MRTTLRATILGVMFVGLLLLALPFFVRPRGDTVGPYYFEHKDMLVLMGWVKETYVDHPEVRVRALNSSDRSTWPSDYDVVHCLEDSLTRNAEYFIPHAIVGRKYGSLANGTSLVLATFRGKTPKTIVGIKVGDLE